MEERRTESGRAYGKKDNNEHKSKTEHEEDGLSVDDSRKQRKKKKTQDSFTEDEACFRALNDVVLESLFGKLSPPFCQSRFPQSRYLM